MRTKILQKVTMFGRREEYPFESQNGFCKSLAQIYSEPIQPSKSYEWNSTGQFQGLRLPYFDTGSFVWSTFTGVCYHTKHFMIGDIPLFMNNLSLCVICWHKLGESGSCADNDSGHTALSLQVQGSKRYAAAGVDIFSFMKMFNSLIVNV